MPAYNPGGALAIGDALGPPPPPADVAGRGASFGRARHPPPMPSPLIFFRVSGRLPSDPLLPLREAIRALRHRPKRRTRGPLPFIATRLSQPDAQEALPNGPGSSPLSVRGWHRLCREVARFHRFRLLVRVLLLDSQANFRRALAIGLRLDGVEVHEAADLREAERLLDSETLDAVVIHLELPGPHLDFLALVRRRLPGCQIVVCHAHQEVLDAARVAHYGTALELRLPFSAQDLLECLHGESHRTK